MTPEEKIAKILELRKVLNEVKCECSSFTLQYEGSCQCQFKSRKRKAFQDLFDFIDLELEK